MGKPRLHSAAAAVCVAVCGALLLTGCGGDQIADPPGSPFKTDSSSPAGPAASGNPGASTTATVTVTADPTGGGTGTDPTSGPSSTDPASTGPTTSNAPATDRLDYSTLVSAPPTPIGASGVKVTTTETVQTMLPGQLDPAPFPPISTSTRLGKPATVNRKDPVQAAAAFVTLMESPRALDSNADNATQRAAPLITDDLAQQLLIKATQAAADRPPTGYVQVTIRNAYATKTNIAVAGGTGLSITVVYDRITLLTPSSTFNAQKFLVRRCTLVKVDGKWTVAGYQPGAN